MKKILLIGLVLAMLVLAGCGPKVTTRGSTTTIKSSGGQATITVDEEGSDSWCAAGSNWRYSGTTPEGAGSAEWKVDELMTSGKYSGLCHVIYTARSPEGEEMRVEYYFSEDGDTGYMVVENEGQTFEQEWSE